MKTILSFGLRASDLILSLCILLASAASAEAATTYFSADAESGTVRPPWQDTSGGGSIETSSIQKHSGNLSYRYELPNPCPNPCTQTETQALTVIKPKKQQAYYSYWGFIDEGLNDNGGVQFKFKADISSVGTGFGPKIHLSVHNKGAGRQLYLGLVNCKVNDDSEIIVGAPQPTNKTCEYQQEIGKELTVPFRKWYHVEMYLKATETNGEIKVWQDGTLIYHISHSNLNTLTCPASDNCSKAFDREFLHWNAGLYQYKSVTLQRMYIDEALITDYQVSASLSGGDTQAPSIPQNLSASAVSSSQINLSWNASTDNVGVTGYELERCQGASCTSFAQIATPSATNYSDTGLSPATAYRYQVRAADATGNKSGYSTLANASTLAGSLRGDLNGSGAVDLTDLRLLIEMIVGQTPPNLTTADLDADGQLSLGDVRELINIIISP